MGVAIWFGEYEIEASIGFSDPQLAVGVVVVLLLLAVIICLVKALRDV